MNMTQGDISTLILMSIIMKGLQKGYTTPSSTDCIEHKTGSNFWYPPPPSLD
jgi:hypothetical protein